jgi:serine/threonine-protein kinase
MSVAAGGSPTFAEGARIGSYVVGPRLGEGATGAVYRAVRGDGLEVALKVLKQALAQDKTYLARFRREARVATEVQHRNLVPVLEFGEDRGLVFMATEFRDDGSLADLIAADGRLPVADCARLAAEIAAGLGALHHHGIVHRDVKPSNVMLDRARASALTDFGLARGYAYTVLTRPGQVLGTLDYLAPELIEGKEATPASDVYALGCLVYECVTGMPPFSEGGIFEVAVAHMEQDPPDPRTFRDTLSDDFAWALLRALQKDPAERPPTATSYAHILSVATQ